MGPKKKYRSGPDVIEHVNIGTCSEEHEQILLLLVVLVFVLIVTGWTDDDLDLAATFVRGGPGRISIRGGSGRISIRGGSERNSKFPHKITKCTD